MDINCCVVPDAASTEFGGRSSACLVFVPRVKQAQESQQAKIVSFGGIVEFQ